MTFWNSQIPYNHPSLEISKKIQQINKELIENNKIIYNNILDLMIFK